MNDEIKEMNLSEMLFNRDEQLLDYITKLQEDVRTGQEINSELQQENERLKEENNNKAMNDYAHAIDESWYRELYDDYKSRCEKAIEYIKEAIENDDYFEDDIATDISEPSYDKYVNSSSLLNILQNGSDSQ